MRVIALAMLLATGCSAAMLDTDRCESNQDCQAAFGYGSVCVTEKGPEEGYCAPTKLHPRCAESTTPDDRPLTFPLPQDENLVMGSLFGRLEAEQRANFRAVDMAVAQVNSQGALGAHEFTAIHCNYDDVPDDDLSRDEAVLEVGEWLASEVGVPVIVGPHASQLCIDLFKQLNDTLGIPTMLISPSATSDDLTQVDGQVSTNEEPGLFWRTAPPDSLQGVAIATDMRTEFDPTGVDNVRTAPSDRVAIIYKDDAYGLGLQTVVATTLSGLGGQAVPKPFSDDGSRSQAIAEVATDGGFDEVVFISPDNADYTAFLLGAAGNAAYAQMPLFFSDGGASAQILDDAASASALFPNIRGSIATSPGGVVYENFAAAYRGRFSGDDPTQHGYAAHSYDAAYLAMYGFAYADGQENSSGALQVARGLRKVSSGQSLNIQSSTWLSASGALQAGGTIDVVGASGPLQYDPSSGEIPALIEVFVVNDQGTGFEAEYVFGD